MRPIKLLIYASIITIMTGPVMAWAQSACETDACSLEQKYDSCISNMDSHEAFVSCYGDYMFDFCNSYADEEGFETCMTVGKDIARDKSEKIQNQINVRQGNWQKLYINERIDAPVIVKTGSSQTGSHQLKIGCIDNKSFVMFEPGIETDTKTAIFFSDAQGTPQAYPWVQATGGEIVINPQDPGSIVKKVKSNYEFAFAAKTSSDTNVIIFERDDFEAALPHLKSCGIK